MNELFENKLKTKINQIELPNLIMNASGTFGYGEQFKEIFDLNCLGAVVLKTLTPTAQKGNLEPHIAFTKNGIINSVGLKNPGIKQLEAIINNLNTERIIVSIGGYNIEDYLKCVEYINNLASSKVIGIELNVSCPNLKSKQIIGADLSDLALITSQVCKLANYPVFVKLTPSVSKITQFAKVAAENGASGLVMCNTFHGLVIDELSGKPLVGNKIGGYSGSGIKPIVLNYIYQVYQVVDIPIIASGGVSSAQDVIDYLSAGASAVQIGTANYFNKRACLDISLELVELLKKRKISKIENLIGRSHE